jgi:hypothetical protein
MKIKKGISFNEYSMNSTVEKKRQNVNYQNYISLS